MKKLLKTIIGACFMTSFMIASAAENENEGGNEKDKGTLSGHITTSDGAPAGSVSVYINELKKHRITDGDGFYQFENLEEGEYTLHVSMLNYKIVTHKFQIKKNETTTLDLQLSVEAKKLKEVVVTGSKKTSGSIEIGKNEINRNRGTANGDVLNGIPGISVNNIRNEAGALDIGIRGLQGDGRVPIMVDGSLQSAQTFRGYMGSSDRTYIDMDLVKKIKVDKGSSTNPNAIGATGGFVEMETIDAEDVVSGNKKFGVYIKGNIFNNSQLPTIPKDEDDQVYYILQDNSKRDRINNGSATAAIAFKDKKFDALVAYNVHTQGNYFAGENGADRYGYDPIYYDTFDPENSDKYKKPVIQPGEEVVNTSYQSQSALAKLGWNIAPHHRVEFNYRYHKQKAGEVLAAYWYKNNNDKNFKDLPDDVESVPQWALGTAELNNYTVNYTFNPNDLVHLNVSVFANEANFFQRNGLIQTPGAGNGDQYLHRFTNDRKGALISNQTKFSGIPLTLQYGINTQIEKIVPKDVPEGRTGSSRNGKREEYSAFVAGDLVVNKFLFQANMRVHETKVSDYNADRDLKYDAKLNIGGKVVYTPIQQLNLFAKASNTYRNPSLYESTESIQTFSYNEKYPLRAEGTTTIELGFDSNFDNLLLEDDHFNFGATVFQNNTRGYISAATMMPDYDFIFLNYDRFKLKGLELAMGYISRQFFFNASAILYRDAVVTSNILGAQDGTNPTNSLGFAWSLLPARIPPKQSFMAEIGGSTEDKKLTVGSRLRWHSLKENPKDWLEGTGASSVATTIPADYILDVYGMYRFNDNFIMNLNIGNVTDRYTYDVGTVITMPVPGRTIRLGMEVKF
ncbi:carboxypeptidase-like regulatory domain-containing protein [Flavobacterium sp. FlaQc-50]|uniref:TonB-dependent receptor n=1 Tax=unclassified Flavobacterium TaxID=196869 RepID=UPI003757FC2F